MSYDSWGDSWGVAWGVSWLHPDSGPVVPPTPQFPIGGGYNPSQGRTKQKISRDREKLGLEDELARKSRQAAEQVIREVALRQAEKLELDKQKQFEELSRELKLNKIQWEGQYLQDLNRERERLITLEIATRLKAKLSEEADLMALILLAASS